ncbi:MAG: AAA family ATPase, partial [Clostridia bacterium]|nr:AAA family ATPase [Clostridia bacterium]
MIDTSKLQDVLAAYKLEFDAAESRERPKAAPGQKEGVVRDETDGSGSNGQPAGDSTAESAGGMNAWMETCGQDGNDGTGPDRSMNPDDSGAALCAAPESYDPGLSVDRWLSLLNDPLVFMTGSLEVMRRMKDMGGEAGARELADKYGGAVSFYSGGSTTLARRIAEKTGCPLPVFTETDHRDGYAGAAEEDGQDAPGEIEYWRILYEGRYDEETEALIWSLRHELSEALDHMDLSDVKLYVNPAKEHRILPENAYDRSRFLEEVYTGPGELDDMLLILKRKKSLILTGAPGVGKSFAAERLAFAFMGEKDESRICRVSFHPGYTYDDFVMGYKPGATGPEMTYGVFGRFCRDAADEPELDHFFIIDNMDCGDICRVFGETLELICPESRGKSITLSSGQRFSVPENLYIIGTALSEQPENQGNLNKMESPGHVTKSLENRGDTAEAGNSGRVPKHPDEHSDFLEIENAGRVPGRLENQGGMKVMEGSGPVAEPLENRGDTAEAGNSGRVPKHPDEHSSTTEFINSGRVMNGLNTALFPGNRSSLIR